MNLKYNVLWLDDEPIDLFEVICNDNPEITFEKKDYVDICKSIIEYQPEHYHAVILDANGISSDSPEKAANKDGFIELVRAVIDNHLPLYIYSGQLSRASDGDTPGLALEALHSLGVDDDRIFYKSGGPLDLIDKIKKDLENKFQYYLGGHEHFLSFFTNHWLSYDSKSQFLDPIMEYYHTKNYDASHCNLMRNITEQMLEKVNEELKINETKKDDSNHYRYIVDSIKRKKLDDSQFVCGSLYHMLDISNAGSHNAIPKDERELYFQSDFSTFFVVANWFYKIMYKIMKAKENDSPKESTPSAQPDGFSSGDNDKTKPESSNANKNNNTGLTKQLTHDNNRTWVSVPTYEEEGKIYCNLKVQIPPRYKDHKKVRITSVVPDTKRRDLVWKVYIQD